MRSKGCSVQIFLGILLAIILTQCSCMAPAALPTVAATIESVNKDVLIHTPAPTPELIRSVCLSADTVYLRAGAGTGEAVKAVLVAGERVTITGEMVISPDMGVWYPVRAGEFSGFVNARYICE